MKKLSLLPLPVLIVPSVSACTGMPVFYQTNKEGDLNTGLAVAANADKSKFFAENANAAVNESGKAKDADLFSTVTISIGRFKKLMNKAAY